MRFFTFLLIVIFIFSCKEAPELRLKVETIKTKLTAKNNDYLKYHQPEKIGQQIEIQFIKNKDNNKQYGIMSCSYGGDFKTDNKDFKLQVNNCDSNYPTIIEFQNNKSIEYKLIVTKNPNSKIKYFKIGYKKIVIPKNAGIIDFYNEQHENEKYEILWSEPIKFE